MVNKSENLEEKKFQKLKKKIQNKGKNLLKKIQTKPKNQQ